jgi:NADH-quinone oxidoreductase subunit E
MNREVIVSSGKIARKLSEAEVKEIEHELTLYPDKKAVGLEALKIVQRHNGWVSDESMLAISRYLDIALSELEGVATFFNLIYRRPVGKNVILFCESVSCWIMGCEKIRKEINDHLGIDYGETTEDGEYTLIPVPCLGDCDNAPVMLVGEKMHRNLTVDSIKSLSGSSETQNKVGESA